VLKQLPAWHIYVVSASILIMAIIIKNIDPNDKNFIELKDCHINVSFNENISYGFHSTFLKDWLKKEFFRNIDNPNQQGSLDTNALSDSDRRFIENL
jgi:hypothetical protein